MAGEQDIQNIDEALLARVASLSRGSQRWLKTAIHSIRLMPPADEDEQAPEGGPPPAPQARPAAPEESERAHRQQSLEDVITGRARLEDQLEQYPELAEELEGLGDVIDMLRDLGQQRRRRGEQILREEILGQPPEDEENDSS